MLNRAMKYIDKINNIYSKKALDARQAELDKSQTELSKWHRDLEQREFRLKSDILKYNALVKEFQKDFPTSVDHAPWQHPYLTGTNIQRFREYSDRIWQYALDYARDNPRPLRIAFTVNMAQNMHNWAWLAQRYGMEVGLFPVVWDRSAIGSPEWENFDGEWPDIYDGEGFRKVNPDIHLEVPCYRIPMVAYDFYDAYQEYFLNGNRTPLLHFLAKAPDIRYEVMMRYQLGYHYYYWTEAVARYDVIYGTSMPLNAYFSGRPYCVFSCGHDLEYDAGRGDEYGQLLNLCFNSARFLLISNPHTLAHCRRLGLTNGVYLPYPMDDSRYCPGDAHARADWEAQYGKGIFVLMSARLDPEVKGQDEKFLQTLVDIANQRPMLRFVFLAWGESAEKFRARVAATGLGNQFIILKPVGKKRLIDYYRSCDIVLDQFVYGYYGLTALEAAAIGKPVVMMIRKEQYSPLYQGDIMPVLNAATSAEMTQALLQLVDSDRLREQTGNAMRQWLVRTHGADKTMSLMLALFRLTADRVPLPEGLVNPFWDEKTEEEKQYHQDCFQQ
jgi:glycosyltransferase involved in cell wall biosynthesis